MTNYSPAQPSTPRNGILNQVHRYLNTLGSWSTYRDLSRPEQLPQRLAPT